MKVYRSAVRAIEPGHVDRFYWDNGHQSITVIEDAVSPHDTGLLDERGRKIMCTEVMDPVGFNRS